MDSLAIAANGLVADSLGRGDVDRARQAAERCCGFGGAISIALFLLLGIAPMSVAMIFTDNTFDPASS
jgi:Na+-driven multidrug efflux pump